MGYYFIYYLLGIILLPGIVLSVYAQTKVNSTYSKYSEKTTYSQSPAHKVARHLLDSAGLYNIQVNHCSGQLTDHYNPKTKTVSLSDSVYDSSSISALGVMAHEIGHVLQEKDNYPLMKIRKLLIPIYNFTSFLMWPLVMLGIILEFTIYVNAGTILIYIGIGIFALSTIISLITLPLEKNASKRAHTLLVKTGILSEQEGEEVKEVLNAAAMTYLASLITSILSLIRFLLFIFLSRKKD